MIASNNFSKNQPQLPIAFPDFLDWKVQSKTFKGMAAMQPSMTNISDPDKPAAQYSSARVSANTFSLLGQQPLIGRDFLPDEDQGSGTQVAILGYNLWKSRYSGDREILGKTLQLNEQNFTVIGVMPEGVQFPFNQEIWTPLVPGGPASNLLRRDTTNNLAFGRLADGVTLADAQAEMDVIAKRLQSEYPATNQGRGITVMPYTNFFAPATIRMLFLAMLGAVGFVLLIACANVANLLLARAVARSREVSIRAALGASRRRIVRQLLVESALLSLLGGIAGFFISLWGIRLFRAALPPGVPYWMDFSMDYRGFAYLAGYMRGDHCVVWADARAVHHQGGPQRNAEGGHTRKRRCACPPLSRGLVVAELALALVLLVAAGLMIRSFLKLQGMSAAFQNDKILTAWVYLGGTTYLTAEPRIRFLERLETELQSTPGAKVAMGSASSAEWQLHMAVRIGRQAHSRSQRSAVGLGAGDHPRVLRCAGNTCAEGTDLRFRRRNREPICRHRQSTIREQALAGRKRDRETHSNNEGGWGFAIRGH